MADKRQVVIVSAARTAIGRFQGALGSVPASTLGSVVIREAVKRAGIDPARIDEVLMGNVVQAGQGQAPARQASIQAGLDPTIGATTVNKICGSGLKTVMMAAQAIVAGDADILVAGGMESMTLGPYLLPKRGEATGLATEPLWTPLCAMVCGALSRTSTWAMRQSG